MTSAAASALPLFYRNPMLLRSQEHGTFGLRRAHDFRFAADTAVVPLVASEFAPASRHYPIVFAPDATATPLAVLGVAAGRNLFVDGEGQWRAGAYVPGYVRRYPFVPMTHESGGAPMLAVDSASPRVVNQLSGEEADAFFDAAGKPTPTSQAAMAFCESYRLEALRIAAFAKALLEHKLLVDRTVRINYHAPKDSTEAPPPEAIINGFRMVDEAAFRALPAEVVAQFHREGWTDLVVLHLASQLGWQTLVEASAPKAAKAAAAA
ncbi:hypothetical protein EJV44_22190 [Ancylobacter aquaticus]|nr:hypothetical protein EJV44_22190 [Ancylobacter aquaticus]